MSHYEVDLRGPLAEPVAEQLRSRFGDVVVRSGTGPAGAVLVLRGADPAAQRALLTLLWDTGHDVLALRTDEERTP